MARPMGEPLVFWDGREWLVRIELDVDATRAVADALGPGDSAHVILMDAAREAERNNAQSGVR